MLRLTTAQRQVLLHCQLAADRSVKEIAQRAKKTTTSVRRVLDTLVLDRLITRRVFINLPAVGHTTFQLLLTLAPTEKKIINELERWFSLHHSLMDVNRIGGEHHYGVTLVGRTIEVVGAFLDTMCATFGPIVAHKEVATIRSLTLFGSKWLLPGAVPQPALSYSAHEVVSHDESDLALLSHMTNDAPHSLAAAARALKIPVSTAEYRWHRARKQKIIVGEFYELASGRLGMNTYLFLVSCNHTSSNFNAIFLKFAQMHRNIDLIARTIGSWDYALHVQVEHHTEVAQLSLELYTQFPLCITKVRVIPSFYNVIYSPFPLSPSES